jgi:uncharacterized protein (TIGR02001 family)
MKKSLFALTASLAVSALPSIVLAEDNPLSFNVSLTTDYRYRGISQTRLKPAVQGGADYALPGGLYIGTWASTIKWIKDAGQLQTPAVDTGNSNIEWDIYGGYKGEISKELSYDVGLLLYVYPGNDLSNIAGAKNANTTEIYGALSFGPATLKYSHSLTSLFGTASATADSKNSGYLDLSATFDVGNGFSLTPHLGYQKVAKFSDLSYTDYALTLAKDWEGFSWSAAAVGADVKRIAGVPAYVSPSGKDLGKAALVLAVKKTF